MLNAQKYAPLNISSPAQSRVSLDRPQEPCLQAKADELLKFISQLEHQTGRIDAYLYGEKINSEAAGMESPSSLEQKLCEACSRVAMLCGFTGTMLTKLNGDQ